MLKTLRDAGLKTVIFEAGNDIGGTWRWNRYPGAGVDCEVSVYEFSWPEVYNTWNWSTNYPDYRDLRSYFDHVDKVVGIKKDCSFNTVVVGAQFDTSRGRWSIRTADGRATSAKYLILATGFAAKRYIPSWPGSDKFKGLIQHSSFWPEESIDVTGKRCAVVGWHPPSLQRTPNLALPMRKRELTVAEQENSKHLYKDLFQRREKTWAGFFFDWCERSALEDIHERREEFYNKLWSEGGFRFWVASYKDQMLDAESNKEAYNFWASKIRARLSDPVAKDVLAPLEMPHYFGVKRLCHEDTYYEQFNQESVHVVDIKQNPIREFTTTGITLEDGTHHEFDVIALATGFDVVTGAMTQLGLESVHGTKLENDWASGAKTYLGLTISGYPNMFYIYGTQAPTLLCNGPTFAELQGRWIADAITKMESSGIKYINAKSEAAEKWRKHILNVCDKTLLPTTRSTYMGGSIPGKVYEPVVYSGGTATYAVEIREALDNIASGFDLVKD
ncbi:Flavin monooxygenase-like protein [Akanthomyces lecanii RCEF 1005]|uniref:Flavin monooxygenase-like protein n=1 Tax=Akanthomyces lecanii RCEF 1005 TaxID=1081108 RepID=A0A168JHM2_CORDF|nr:Flavin monooxygenase-like protein [Akanthomyces lecanii RCEF 1005]